MNFYVLESPKEVKGLAVTDFLSVAPQHEGETPKCPDCGKFIGLIPWLPPHYAELEVWGKEFGDIAFGPGNEKLVSDRFLNLYKNSGLTGLNVIGEVKIIKVRRRGGSCNKINPPIYYCVKVARSRAAIEQLSSGLDLDDSVVCDECRKGGIVKRIKRVVLENNTWTGEDIFYARGLSGTIITSERFKIFFQKNKINNGVLIPAEEYSFDFYPWEKLKI